MFKDRQDGGKKLAKSLLGYKNKESIVIALPRGGVIVGHEVAKILNAPFDVIVSRKIGAPNNPEFGIGAISEGNTIVLNSDSIKLLKISKEVLDQIIDKKKEEVGRRIHLFRGNRPIIPIYHKTVILVDDGLATGVTAEAAIKSIKKLKPKEIIFASPVCSYETSKVLAEQVDSVVCEITPRNLTAIGNYYRNFQQVSDKEVLETIFLSSLRNRRCQ